jgi:hypothetical protein
VVLDEKKLFFYGFHVNCGSADFTFFIIIIWWIFFSATTTDLDPSIDFSYAGG